MEMKINKTIKDSEQDEEKKKIDDKDTRTNRRYQIACDVLKNHATKILEYMKGNEPISFWLSNNGTALRLTAYSLRNANINVDE